jgi:hypothetical protein
MRKLGSVIAITCALVMCSGCSSGDTSDSTPHQSIAVAESGPRLDGTYKVEVGNFITDNGQQLPRGSGSFELVVRSACKNGACVATAAAPNAHEPNALQAEVVAGELILDYIDDRWVAVETWNGKCTPVGGGDELDTPNWDSFVLEPNPDGTLSGEYTGRGSLETCAGSTRQHVTLTRTGDADPDVELPDPAAQEPRKPTPASGFRGTYEYTSVNVSANVPPGTPGSPKLIYTAQTVCLRTGERCLTYLLTKEGYSRALTFADGKWTETSAPFPGTCLPSGKATKVRRGEFQLPPAPADPIVEVLGHVSEEAMDGPCEGISHFDNTLTRARD